MQNNVQTKQQNSEELMSITLGDLFDLRAKMHPDREAVVYPHEKLRWTWAQFRDECNVVARGMMAMGIKKGDHVAIWATNYPQWLMVMFATAKIGAVMVTVNTNYKAFELEYLLRQSDSCTLVMMDSFKDSNYVSHIRQLCPMLDACQPGQLNNKKLPYLKNVIYIGDADKTPAGMFNWDDLYKLAEQVSEEERAAVQASLDVHDVVNMQYTSGTTGFPKGVMLTHFNIVNDGKAIGDCMAFTPEDRLCIPVPLFHCFGCVLGVMASVTHGTTMVMIKSFNPVRVMQALQWEKCTAVHGVPTMFISMLDHPDFHTYDFSTMRTGIMAGSPCPITFMRRAIEEMNMREITIAYGQTESSPVITQTRTDDPIEVRVNTVGRTLPNMEVKIIDMETGEDAPINTQGEIVTRGYQVMKGYYNMPEATRQAIDENGWLHTGDIGMMDENGYFKITGRLKDMIIRGGENIYPREIEEFLYTNDKVQDVQVVGVPDKRYGEEVLAFVILKPDCTATQEEMIDFIKNGLARHKAPRYVRFIDAFPMTASGKIQKFKLREMGIDMLSLQEAAEVETA
nr:AMP-binding protein [Maliibacterium massiliense]